MKIMVINPGGTSTKTAVFEDEYVLFKKTIIHAADELRRFPHVVDQLDYRRNIILDTLSEAGFVPGDFSCVVGRGGLLAPLQGGTYGVNEQMTKDLKKAVHGEHPSNLGPILAKEIADEVNIPSFIVDPVSVDELMPIARISGLAELERPSWFHALNHKAVAHFIAKRIEREYEDCNFIIAHLGSGNSIVAHKEGRMIDGSGGRSNGPFSPERSGGLPTYPLVELCYSGKYSHEEMVDKISSGGGIYDHLGTKDAREVEERIKKGDEKARTVYQAFVYSVAKEICSYAAVFEGKVDCIILTGGLAHSGYVTEEITRMTGFLAPVEIVPGEFELEALAYGALRVLRKEEEPKCYG